MEHLRGALLWVRILAYIRLGWKNLANENTLAYLVELSVTNKKVFITSTPSPFVSFECENVDNKMQFTVLSKTAPPHYVKA